MTGALRVRHLPVMIATSASLVRWLGAMKIPITEDEKPTARYGHKRLAGVLASALAALSLAGVRGHLAMPLVPRATA
ncbi:MAG: hypothetical protein DME26_18945 [Verrucomicrobia bacterium]|nr:MAG: hypothetical protein DME26_18945 [Verrucomicrobiota bacterium]